MNTAARLEEEEYAARRDLEAGLGGEGSRSELGLTGLEVLGFLAVKVAVPVIASFISREVWERYNKLRTRSQATEAKRELARMPPLQQEMVDEAIVVGGVAQSLLDEGVPQDVAERVARTAYERVKTQVSAGS